MPAEFEQEQRLKELERKDLLRLQGIDDDDDSRSHGDVVGGRSVVLNTASSYGRQIEWGKNKKLTDNDDGLIDDELG